MRAARVLGTFHGAVATTQLRPRTVRLRLTAIYGGLFLLCGIGLLAITYVLVEHSTGDILTYTSTNRSFAAINHTDGPTPRQQRSITIRQGRSPAKPLTQAQAAAQAQRLMTLARQQHTDMLHSLLLDSGIALAIMALLSIGLGWMVAGRVLRPLRTMTNAVRDISATNLHRRLAISAPRDELTALGETFNGLLGRLETAFQAQRQFVANASHELRTPLARQRAIGQVALADPDATVGSLRAAHERVLAAGAQQERLIAALLALARGQSGVIHSESFDLAELVHRVVVAREAEAAVRDIRIDTVLERAPVLGDPRLIETLIANLIENAVRHNVARGWVTVSTTTAGGRAVLHVSNTGPTVPGQDVERLLQPFHRFGSDRGAHGDGLGIGLSIVQAVTSAHDARLTLSPRSHGGLSVEVSFPPGAGRPAYGGDARSDMKVASPA